jgi:ribosome-binding protein aMBF1 (putative translation factor)
MTARQRDARDPEAVLFGMRLREAREAAGLSQVELAKPIRVG